MYLFYAKFIRGQPSVRYIFRGRPLLGGSVNRGFIYCST